MRRLLRFTHRRRFKIHLGRMPGREGIRFAALAFRSSPFERPFHQQWFGGMQFRSACSLATADQPCRSPAAVVHRLTGAVTTWIWRRFLALSEAGAAMEWSRVGVRLHLFARNGPACGNTHDKMVEKAGSWFW
jgi:hypothetical protein